MKRSGSDYINDIVEAAGNIRSFIGDMDFDDFSNDRKTIYAVIRAVEIIGEASKNMPGEIKVSTPDIPWKEMAGMRDIAAHQYFQFDLRILWNTIKENIPQITAPLEKLRKSIEDTE